MNPIYSQVSNQNQSFQFSSESQQSFQYQAENFLNKTPQNSNNLYFQNHARNSNPPPLPPKNRVDQNNLHNLSNQDSVSSPQNILNKPPEIPPRSQIKPPSSLSNSSHAQESSQDLQTTKTFPLTIPPTKHVSSIERQQYHYNQSQQYLSRNKNSSQDSNSPRTPPPYHGYRLYQTEKFFVIEQQISVVQVITKPSLCIERGHPYRVFVRSGSEANKLKENPIKIQAIAGLVGILRTTSEGSHLLVITDCKEVGTIHDLHRIFQIIKVESIPFGSNISADAQGNLYFPLSSTEEQQGVTGGLAQEQGELIAGVLHLLNKGHFYFSPTYDLTLSAQSRRLMWKKKNSTQQQQQQQQQQQKQQQQHKKTQDQINSSSTLHDETNIPHIDWRDSDERFFWNSFIVRDFKRENLDTWVTPIIHGFIQSLSCIHFGKRFQLILISRRSRYRAGTRYIQRGVDDDGNTANFVETEQIVEYLGNFASVVQIRGSVPIFWEQPAPTTSTIVQDKSGRGIAKQVAQQLSKNKKIRLLRNSESHQLAFEKHFNQLLNIYGYQVLINLLTHRESKGEYILTEELQQQLKYYSHSSLIYYIHFDFHELCSGFQYENVSLLTSRLEENLMTSSNSVGFYFELNDGTVVMEQKGVYRTNCKDCLDRTNVVQGSIAKLYLEKQLEKLHIFTQWEKIDKYEDLHSSFKELWANNGDFISIQYAGTGALKSTYTRTGHHGLRGVLIDAKKSVERSLISSFRDPNRQDAIDLLLGHHPNLDLSKYTDQIIRNDLEFRSKEYVSTRETLVWIGTWNVSGNEAGKESLEGWFVGEKENGVEVKWWNEKSRPDLYVIGIQEVVELTPGKILTTDPILGKGWERCISKTLERLWGINEYSLIHSEQLVGIYLCVFAYKERQKEIRKVEYEAVKVGIHGLAGNKGGISIRLEIGSSSFCFVCVHLAAGQKEVDERNNNLIEISKGVRFGRQRQLTIEDHDFVFWFGDFNYRLDLEFEVAKQLAQNYQIETLLAFDQLLQQQREGKAFTDLKEDQITFRPTYKYDPFTQIYDTSSKMRTPSWTDRILRGGKKGSDERIKCLFYDRSELVSSDHRPVSAFYALRIDITDEEKKNILETQLTDDFTKRVTLSLNTKQLNQEFKKMEKSDPLSYSMSSIPDFPKVTQVRPTSSYSVSPSKQQPATPNRLPIQRPSPLPSTQSLENISGTSSKLLVSKSQSSSPGLAMTSSPRQVKQNEQNINKTMEKMVKSDGTFDDFDLEFNFTSSRRTAIYVPNKKKENETKG